MKNKRIISAIIAAMLAASALYGCSSTNQVTKGNDTAAEEAAVNEKEEETEPEEEVPEETEPEEEVPEETEPDEEIPEETKPDEDAPEETKPEATDNAGITIETENKVNIPDLSLWGITAEDFTVTFGVDITDINLENFDSMTTEEKQQLLALLNITESNFSAEDFEKIRDMSYEELIAFFKEKIEFFSSLKALVDGAGLNAAVDSVNGAIVMESAVLFEYDKEDVSDAGKELINDLVNIYSVILTNEKFAGYIDSVIIEGHTDDNGSYEYNLELSQRRADNVLSYCISEETGAGEETRAKLAQLLTAQGFSESKPVKNDDGTVNAEKSRRVEFRFIINVD